MQILSIVSLLIATAFTGAFKPTAWKANQLLRMSTSGSNGAFLKLTSSKVKAAAAVGLLFAGGLIASPVTPAWAATPVTQSGSFKKIVLPNKVEFNFGNADPNARLLYTCPDDLSQGATAEVSTVLAPTKTFSFLQEASSETICKSKQVTVVLKNPAPGSPDTPPVLAIDTPGNWKTSYTGNGVWTIVAAP